MTADHLKLSSFGPLADVKPMSNDLVHVMLILFFHEYTMDKLQLTGENLGRVFDSVCECARVCHVHEKSFCPESVFLVVCDPSVNEL